MNTPVPAFQEAPLLKVVGGVESLQPLHGIGVKSFSNVVDYAEAKIADNEASHGVAFVKHDFKPGDLMEITYSNLSPYNGRFIVTEVPDEKTFRFQLSSDPGGDSNSGYYGKVWQTKKFEVEGLESRIEETILAAL